MSNIQYNTQPKQSEKKLVKILLFLVIITTIVVAIIGNQNRRQALLDQEPIIQDNSWNSVTPGFVFTQSAKEKLGTPVKVLETDGGTQYSYKTEFPTLNNTVTTNENEVVNLIIEYFTYDPNHTIEQYIQQFGEPELELRTNFFSEFTIAHVFLSKGIAVLVHEADNSVEIKWYFEPTDEVGFMAKFGEYFSEEGQSHGPETFE